MLGKAFVKCTIWGLCGSLNAGVGVPLYYLPSPRLGWWGWLLTHLPSLQPNVLKKWWSPQFWQSDAWHQLKIYLKFEWVYCNGATHMGTCVYPLKSGEGSPNQLWDSTLVGVGCINNFTIPNKVRQHGLVTYKHTSCPSMLKILSLWFVVDSFQMHRATLIGILETNSNAIWSSKNMTSHTQTIYECSCWMNERCIYVQ